MAGQSSTVLSSGDYPSAVLSQLYALYKKGSLCDVTLATDDDQCFRVHSLILVTASTYFSSMASMHTHYTIRNVDSGCLRRLVDFLYTGTLSLTPATAPVLYTAACHLQISQAAQLCQLYLIETVLDKPHALTAIYQQQQQPQSQLQPPQQQQLTQISQPESLKVSDLCIKEELCDVGDADDDLVAVVEEPPQGNDVEEEDDLTSPLSIVLATRKLDSQSEAAAEAQKSVAAPFAKLINAKTEISNLDMRAVELKQVDVLKKGINFVGDAVDSKNKIETNSIENLQIDRKLVLKTERKTGKRKKNTKDNNTRKKKKVLFRCKKCLKKFTTVSELMSHVHMHFQRQRIQKLSLQYRLQNCVRIKKVGEIVRKRRSQGVLYRCRKCKKEFGLSSELSSHVLNSHVSRRSCGKCQCRIPVTWMRLHYATKHVNTYTNRTKSRLKCKVCSRVFLHRQTLRNHTHCNADKSKIMRCHVSGCGFESKSFAKLVEHMNRVHPDVRYKCKRRNCLYTAPLELLLVRHMSRHHSGSQYCEHCDKQFRAAAALNTHLFSKHGIVAQGVKVICCDHTGCSYQCVHPNLIEQHRRKHITADMCVCKTCGRKLKSKKALDKHMNKVHLGIRPYICHQCGLSYGEEAELKTHMARHAETKPFHCHLCDHATFDKATYKAHMYSFHGITVDARMQVLQCDQCAFSTAVRSRFDDHMRVHNQQRDIPCTECPKLFMTRKALRGHVIKVHSPKTCQCRWCGYASGSISKLKEHVRVMHSHRGVRPYKCVYCAFTSATSGNCRKHVMQRHKGADVRYIKLLDKLPEPDLERANETLDVAESSTNAPVNVPDPAFNVTDQNLPGSEECGMAELIVDHNAPGMDHNAPGMDNNAPSLDHNAPSLDPNAPSMDHNAPSVIQHRQQSHNVLKEEIQPVQHHNDPDLAQFIHTTEITEGAQLFVVTSDGYTPMIKQ